jgi:AcrR family transcriptional regulator
MLAESEDEMRKKTKTRLEPKGAAGAAGASRKLAPEKISKGEKTHARLLAGAIEEFFQHGFHAARISGIAARAGVTQPAFYLYFTSKDKVYSYLIQRVQRDLIGIIKRVRVPPALLAESAQGGMRAAIQAFLQYFADNPQLATIGYFESQTSAALRNEVTRWVARNIAAEQSAGYFRQDLDPTFLAECYCGTIDRLIRRYLLTGKEDVATLSRRVADIYFNGILSERE